MSTPDQHIGQVTTYAAGGAGFLVYLTDPQVWVVALTIITLLIRIISDLPRACKAIKAMLGRKTKHDDRIDKL